MREAYEYDRRVFFCGHVCIRMASLSQRLDEGDRVPRCGIVRQRDGDPQRQGLHGAPDGVHQAGPRFLRHLPGHAGAMLVLAHQRAFFLSFFGGIESIGL